MDETLNTVNAVQEPAVEVQSVGTEKVTELAEPAKTNNAEAVEPQQDKKPEQSREDNAAAAAARRREKAEADKRIAEADDRAAATLASRYNLTLADGTPVKTRAQLDQYDVEQDFKQRGLDPEAVNKAAENHPLVKKAREDEARKAEQDKLTNEYSALINAFREETGRIINLKEDAVIYSKILAEAEKTGKSYADAYKNIRFSELKAEKSALEAKLKAQETNKANAASSPGSVNAEGSAAGTDYITPEEFESHRGNQNWVNKNFNKIIESRKKWGG